MLGSQSRTKYFIVQLKVQETGKQSRQSTADNLKQETSQVLELYVGPTCCGVILWQADKAVAGAWLTVRQAGCRDILYNFICLGRLHLDHHLLQELVV